MTRSRDLDIGHRPATIVPFPKSTGRDGRMRIEVDDVPIPALQDERFISHTVSSLPTVGIKDTHGSTTSFLRVDDQGVAEARYSAFDSAACPCGSTWWTLQDGERGESGAIVLAPDLTVVGWSGTAVCVDCERRLELAVEQQE